MTSSVPKKQNRYQKGETVMLSHRRGFVRIMGVPGDSLAEAYGRPLSPGIKLPDEKIKQGVYIVKTVHGQIMNIKESDITGHQRSFV